MPTNTISRVIWLLGGLLLSLSVIRVAAQQERVPASNGNMRLTMDDAIHMAFTGNRQLRQAQLDEKIAGAQYRETDAVFLPQAAISYSAMTTDNPLNAFGFRLQQASVAQADFDPSRLNHPGGTPDFLTSVDIRQPIVNLDLFYQRKGAAAAIGIYSFRTQRTKEGLTFQVKQAYMGLQLADAAVRVLESSLTTADSLRQFIADRVQQGMLSQADVSNADVRVAAISSRLAEARSEVRNASDALGLLMGSAPGQVYEVAAQLQPAMPVAAADGGVPAGRADLAAMEKAIQAAGFGIRSTKLSGLPRLNAFGSWQYNDDRPLGFGAHAYLAGVQLSWDIFKGNSVRNKLATQRMQREKMVSELAGQREAANIQLRKALRRQDDAGYTIREATIGVTAATESLRILRDRYAQGLAGSTDVLLAQDQLEVQRLLLIKANFAYNVAGAYIEFLTIAGGGAKN